MASSSSKSHCRYDLREQQRNGRRREHRDVDLARSPPNDPTALGRAAREWIICLPSATMSMQMRIEQGRARAMDQCSVSRRRRKTPLANPNTVCVCMKSMDGVEARRRAAKEECEIE